MVPEGSVEGSEGAPALLEPVLRRRKKGKTQHTGCSCPKNTEQRETIKKWPIFPLLPPIESSSTLARSSTNTLNKNTKDYSKHQWMLRPRPYICAVCWHYIVQCTPLLSWRGWQAIFTHTTHCLPHFLLLWGTAKWCLCCVQQSAVFLTHKQQTAEL